MFTLQEENPIGNFYIFSCSLPSTSSSSGILVEVPQSGYSAINLLLPQMQHLCGGGMFVRISECR